MKAAFKALFGLDKLYARKYGVAFIYPFLMFFFIWWGYLIVYNIFAQSPIVNIFAVTLCALVALYFLQELIKTLYVWYVTVHRNYSPFIQNKYISKISKAGVNSELEKVDNQQFIESGDNWGLTDISFNFYSGKAKEHLTNQHYYTVMETKLQRLLPHVVFDSKHAKGSQFKKLYHGAQRLSFEGNFDDYFESYGPKTYHVDTLSFITPEVLQAILALKDCDIEILDDSLIVFASLLDNNELEDFKTRSNKLFHALNDNINTYRDDRLYGDKRKKDVTMFSKKLLENPRRYLLSAIVSTFITIGILGSAIYYKKPGILINQVSLIIFASAISINWKTISILHRNKVAEKSFAFETSVKHAVNRYANQ